MILSKLYTHLAHCLIHNQCLQNARYFNILLLCFIEQAIKEKLVLMISEAGAKDGWRCNLTKVFGYALHVSPL